MLDFPTISVVIPLYNKGEYIKRALTSVLNQTCRVLEIIVVDDGSTDEGLERVERLARANSTIRIIRQENKGPGAARNAGLHIAEGKYIAFLDADDEWYPSFLETGTTLMENNDDGVSVFFTGYFSHPAMRLNGKGLEYLKGMYEVTPETKVALVADIEKFVSMTFSIIRTDTAIKWGGYFDGFKCLRGEDTYFFLKLLFNEKIWIIPEPYGEYHTEASDLFGCGCKAIPPISVYLTHANDLLACCPPDKIHILRGYLSLRALEQAVMYSKLGQKKVAIELLNRYSNCEPFYSRKLLITRMFSRLSPVLPSVRRIWRLSKSLVR
jgi:glycosyltransferase involved in cell wall biosynthesis